MPYLTAQQVTLLARSPRSSCKCDAERQAVNTNDRIIGLTRLDMLLDVQQKYLQKDYAVYTFLEVSSTDSKMKRGCCSLQTYANFICAVRRI